MLRSLGPVYLTNQRVFSYAKDEERGRSEVRTSFIRDVDTVAISKAQIRELAMVGTLAFLGSGGAFIWALNSNRDTAALMGLSAVCALIGIVLFILFAMLGRYEMTMYVSGRAQIVDDRIARQSDDFDEIANAFATIKAELLK